MLRTLVVCNTSEWHAIVSDHHDIFSFGLYQNRHGVGTGEQECYLTICCGILTFDSPLGARLHIQSYHCHCSDTISNRAQSPQGIHAIDMIFKSGISPSTLVLQRYMFYIDDLDWANIEYFCRNISSTLALKSSSSSLLAICRSFFALSSSFMTFICLVYTVYPKPQDIDRWKGINSQGSQLPPPAQDSPGTSTSTTRPPISASLFQSGSPAPILGASTVETPRAAPPPAHPY